MPCRRLVPSWLAFAAVLAAGCAPRLHPVALEARPADRETLEGVWHGSYEIDGRRSGLIDFELDRGAPQAQGEILLIARGAMRPLIRGAMDQPGPGVGPATERLTFRFVRAADGRLTGSVTAYWDPDRACQATATFAGTIAGRTMAGTLASTCESGGPMYLGRWSMARVAAPPDRRGRPPT